MQTSTKVISTIIVVLLLGLGVFCYFRYWFPYAEGTDTGELNFFSYQGVVFKTYEGKVIQTGLRANAANQAGIQSNEFVFSVDNPVIADSLMHCTGKQVELHYKRYFAPLPWRGQSVFIVDSIWSVK